MSNPYDANVLDDAGNVRISGAVDFTDPDNQPGGGSQPIQGGAGSPVDSVTPTATGYVYIDSETGALYLATGPTDTDWLVLGRITGNVGEATGIGWLDSTRDIYMLAGERDSLATFLYIGSAYAQWNGHTQGLHMHYVDVGGNLEVNVQLITGAAGQYIGTLQDGNGRMVLANTVDVTNMPTANPGPNLLWNDGGVLKIGT